MSEKSDINETKSTDVSPDPSPIKNPKIQQYVIIKEYKGISKETPKVKNYMQKTIVKEQLDKSERKTFYLDLSPKKENSHNTHNTQKTQKESTRWWQLSEMKKALIVGALIVGGSVGVYQYSKTGTT